MSGRIWDVEMGGGESAPQSVRLERNGLLLRVRIILVAEGRPGWRTPWSRRPSRDAEPFVLSRRSGHEQQIV